MPLIGEAIGNVEYQVVRQIPFDDDMDLFVGEVLATHIRKGVMDGELYRADANPLLYMGTPYENGKSAGKYYAHLSGIGPADYDSPLLKEYLSRPKRQTLKGRSSCNETKNIPFGGFHRHGDERTSSFSRFGFAASAPLPKATEELVKKLKLEPSLLANIEKEFEVPKAWLDGARKEGKLRHFFHLRPWPSGSSRATVQ